MVTDPSQPAPLARVISTLRARRQSWAIIKHRGVHHLPWTAVIAELGVTTGWGIALSLNDTANALGLITLAVPAHQVMPVIVSGALSTCVCIPLDRLLVFLTTRRLFPDIADPAVNALAHLIQHAVAEFPDDPRVAPLATADTTTGSPPKASAPEVIAPNALRIEVAVQGGDPELNRAVAGLLLQAIDGIPGTRVDAASPTRH